MSDQTASFQTGWKSPLASSLDDLDYGSGVTRYYNKRRIFDRFKDEDAMMSSPVSTPRAPTDGFDYYGSMGSADGGYGAWADAGADYATSYDPAMGRVTDAFTAATVPTALKTALNAGLTYGLGSYMGAPSAALADAVQSSAISGLASSAPKTLGDVTAAGLGIDKSPLGDALGYGSSLLGAFTSPPLGAIASAVSPVVGEGLGKVFGIRPDEGFKQAIENTLGTGFMDTARTRANIRDLANAYGSIKRDSFMDQSGVVNTLGLSPREAAIENAQRAAYGAEMGNWANTVNPRTGYTYNDMLAEMASDLDMPSEYQDTYVDMPGMIRDYDTAINAVPGYSPVANPESPSYRGAFMADAAARGLDVSGVPAGQLSTAIRDYNMYSNPMYGNPLSSIIAQQRQANILSNIAASGGMRGEGLGGGLTGFAERGGVSLSGAPSAISGWGGVSLTGGYTSPSGWGGVSLSGGSPAGTPTGNGGIGGATGEGNGGSNPGGTASGGGYGGFGGGVRGSDSSGAGDSGH